MPRLGRRRAVAPWRVAAPLLADADDVICLARALTDRYPAEPGRAVVLVGHGAAGAAQLSYAALQAYLAAQGRADVLVGTLRGRPGAEEVMAELAALGCRRVLLAPLMLAAGVHTARDIGGTGAGSWCVRLAAAGYEVTVAPEGLAELPAVRELAVRHVLAAVSQPAEDRRGRAAAAAAAAGGGGCGCGLRCVPGERARRVLPARRASRSSSRWRVRAASLRDLERWGSAALGRLRGLARRCSSWTHAGRCPWAQRRMRRMPTTLQAMSGSRQRPPTPHALPGARRMSPLPRATRAMRRRASCSRHLVAGASSWPRVPTGEGDEEDCALVVAATSDRAVNRRIGERCRERGIPVSVADAPEEGTFFFPALCEGERLVAGIVSRDGAHADHALVARAARDVRSILP